MSYAYRQRKKAIKAIKKRLPDEYSSIPKKDFAIIQANWRRQIDGPPLGTLEDVMELK